MLVYYTEICKSAKFSGEVKVAEEEPQEIVYWIPKNVIIGDLVKEGYYLEGWDSVLPTDDRDRDSWLKIYKTPFGVCENPHGTILLSDMADDNAYPKGWETMKNKVNIGKHANEDTELMNDVYDIGCTWLPRTVLVDRMSNNGYYPKRWKTIKEKTIIKK